MVTKSGERNFITTAFIRELHNTKTTLTVTNAADIHGLSCHLLGMTDLSNKDRENRKVIWHLSIPLDVAIPRSDNGVYWNQGPAEYRFDLIFSVSKGTGGSTSVSEPVVSEYTMPQKLAVSRECRIEYTNKTVNRSESATGEEEFKLCDAYTDQVYGIAETRIHVEDDGRCKYVAEFVEKLPSFFTSTSRDEMKSASADPRWGGF